jgi:hypothetical protein
MKNPEEERRQTDQSLEAERSEADKNFDERRGTHGTR